LDLLQAKTYGPTLDITQRTDKLTSKKEAVPQKEDHIVVEAEAILRPVAIPIKEVNTTQEAPPEANQEDTTTPEGALEDVLLLTKDTTTINIDRSPFFLSRYSLLVDQISSINKHC